MWRVCLICKIPIRSLGLCDFCAPRLFAVREPVVRFEKQFLIRSLFSWRDQDPPALQWLIQSLKHQALPQPWSELAAWLLQANIAQERGLTALVPIPSSEQCFNHALGLSRALAELTGWTVCEPLRLRQREGRAQKSLNRNERQSAEYDICPEWNCTDYKTVVIIDDVVTTGATARAAFRALQPQTCEVWCLMDRRPCENDRALL